VARHPDLEQAILADPEDERAYLVYADWLQAQGDPRGELAARMAAGDDGAELIAAHRAAWLGSFGDFDRRELGWKHGWIHRAAIGSQEKFGLGELYSALVACESARFLTELEVWTGDRSKTPYHYARTGLFEAVAAHGVPFPLRRLRFVEPQAQLWGSALGDAGGLWEHVAGLRELELESGSMALGAIVLPSLRRARLVSSSLTGAKVRAIAAARWPRLTSLELAFGADMYGGADHVLADLEPILRGEGLGELAELGLSDHAEADSLPALLAQSAVLPRLRRLDLSRGVLTDEGGSALLHHARAFAHLESLDLSENAFSESMVEQLRGLCRQVAVGGQEAE
jgi:uncharacterized protein (TIGR02996 family)